MNYMKPLVSPSNFLSVAVLNSQMFRYHSPHSMEVNTTNKTPLSGKVLSNPQQPVGPGASKKGVYKNAEYFCYSRYAYFDAEIEMKRTLPQPSAKNT